MIYDCSFSVNVLVVPVRKILAHPWLLRFLCSGSLTTFLLVSPLRSADMKVTSKSFNFARKFNLPFYFVSAADGTNVVKVKDDGPGGGGGAIAALGFLGIRGRGQLGSPWEGWEERSPPHHSSCSQGDWLGSLFHSFSVTQSN